MIVPPLHGNPACPRRRNSRAEAAFTLVEVILAIFIALGILVVLLYFYQQATDLRSQVLQQTENIAAARLILDRLTGELRTAQSDPAFGGGFIGGSNAIQFIKADVPSFAAWTGGALGRSAFPVTDLKTVRYRLESGADTNVMGLVRSEEPRIPRRQVVALDDLEGTNAVAAAEPPPVLGEIRFLQFRYWSGTNWLTSWTGSGCPEAVEISLGPEALTNGVEETEMPVDVFRRIVYLGAHALAKGPAAPAGPDGDTPAAVEEGATEEEGLP
jgi:type II secretory pathway pseudopilin PulG